MYDDEKKKNTCLFHRAVISTASTTRTRIRRLMADSAPARRCSFPRWCTVPVACCSKTPETGLHGDDTAFAVLPWLRTKQTRLTVSWWIGKPWISGSCWRWNEQPANLGKSLKLFRNRKVDLREFSFGNCIILMVDRISNTERFLRFFWEDWKFNLLFNLCIGWWFLKCDRHTCKVDQYYQKSSNYENFCLPNVIREELIPQGS